jgi:DNA-binding XRE family transcriptional regulator
MTKTKPWREIRRQPADPASAARMDDYRRAMEDALALGRLRESRGATQVEVAGALGVSQPNVSRIERQDDLYLSTLREYVEALGGCLVIAAAFPDETILLTGAGEQPTAGEVSATLGQTTGSQVSGGNPYTAGKEVDTSMGGLSGGTVGVSAGGEVVLSKTIDDEPFSGEIVKEKSGGEQGSDHTSGATNYGLRRRQGH